MCVCPHDMLMLKSRGSITTTWLCKSPTAHVSVVPSDCIMTNMSHRCEFEKHNT